MGRERDVVHRHHAGDREPDRDRVRRGEEEVEVVVPCCGDEIDLFPPCSCASRDGVMTEAPWGLSGKRCAENRGVGTGRGCVDNEFVFVGAWRRQKLAAQLGEIAPNAGPLVHQLSSVDAYAHGMVVMWCACSLARHARSEGPRRREPPGAKPAGSPASPDRAPSHAPPQHPVAA